MPTERYPNATKTRRMAVSSYASANGVCLLPTYFAGLVKVVRPRLANWLAT